MKIINIVGHPVVIICMFLLLVIEGDNFGGPFLLYLVLALPHGVAYAIVAALGIMFLLIGYNIKRIPEYVSPILFLIGYALLIVSLSLFLAMPGNQWRTFYNPIPCATFILFGMLSIFFLLRTFLLFKNPKFGNKWQKLQDA